MQSTAHCGCDTQLSFDEAFTKVGSSPSKSAMVCQPDISIPRLPTGPTMPLGAGKISETALSTRLSGLHGACDNGLFCRNSVAAAAILQARGSQDDLMHS